MLGIDANALSWEKHMQTMGNKEKRVLPHACQNCRQM